jgi:hypothetical protein
MSKRPRWVPKETKVDRYCLEQLVLSKTISIRQGKVVVRRLLQTHLDQFDVASMPLPYVPQESKTIRQATAESL